MVEKKYDYSCECDAEKYPLIERVFDSIHSSENNIFKAKFCKDCIREHKEVMKAEESYN